MCKLLNIFQVTFFILYNLISRSDGAIYTYEDVELRRIFPSEFPQDVVRKSGASDPEHLGRYAELQNYFTAPRAFRNAHFEELVCVQEADSKVCRINSNRYSPEEAKYYNSKNKELSHVDANRVYCFMLICFNELELHEVVKSFR